MTDFIFYYDLFGVGLLFLSLIMLLYTIRYVVPSIDKGINAPLPSDFRSKQSRYTDYLCHFSMPKSLRKHSVLPEDFSASTGDIIMVKATFWLPVTFILMAPAKAIYVRWFF